MINLLPHKIFITNVNIGNKIQLSKYDLFTKITISLPEAICGFAKIIKHVSGNNVNFSSNDIIKDNDIYIMDGQGIPHGNNEYGKLYIMFNIDQPSSLDIDKKRLIWEILTSSPYVERINTNQKKAF